MIREAELQHCPIIMKLLLRHIGWEKDAAVLDTFHQISPFQLWNQEGELISEKTFEGKIYVTDFFFTACPGIMSKNDR